MPDDQIQAQPDWLGSALAKIGDLPTRLNQAALDEGAAYRGRMASEQPQVPETPSFGYGMVEPITQLSPQPQPPYDYYGANLESGRNLSRQSFVDSYERQRAAEPRVAPLNAIASALAGRPVTPYNANPSNYRQLSPSEEAERERATQSEYASLAAGIATPELASATGLARFAPGPNQLNIFLPARAKQVEIASKLEEQGVHPDRILKQTGAFRDVDGRWKREISDANARVIPSEDFLKQYEGAEGPAEAMFEHEKLYKEAPGVKKYQMEYDYQPEFITKEHPDYIPQYEQAAINWEKAGYSPKEILENVHMKRDSNGEWMMQTLPRGTHWGQEKIIGASGYNPEQLRSATLHELTHAVDKGAGVPYGASPDAIYNELSKKSPDEIVKLAEQSKSVGSRGTPDIADYPNDWQGFLKHLANDLYWRTQSEVRARNVEARRNMTDWERRNKHPFETMDVPVEQQIADEPSKFISRSEPAIAQSLPIQRSIDPLGYYSQALEAAKAIPQAKGTPEQMLAQLKKAGVKDAEIQATNLPQFLEGKKSVTRDEIAQHLEDNRVGINKAERVSTQDIDNQIDDLYKQQQNLYETNATGHALDDKRAQLASIDDKITELQDRKSNLNRAEWQEYSLDPRNPTYRETVLHLPDRLSARREDIQKQISEYLERYRTGTGRLNTPEYEALTQELDNLDRQIGENPARNFQSGHFGEPNITGNLMTSMVKDKNGRNVFNVDQIQSDWGQKLREGGVRDEAKIANLEADLGRANEESRRIEVEVEKFVGSIPHRDLNLANYFLRNENPLQQVAYGPAGDLTVLAHYGSPDIQPKAIELYNALNSANTTQSRIQAELDTAKQSPSGHPLVNTTDQWVNTTLRHAIKQAVESGADAISIPHGDTVLSYNPGKEKGMRGFYGTRTQEGVAPKNLRKLLQAIDKDAPSSYRTETLNTSRGTQGYATHGRYPFDETQTGFTVFPLTDKIKQSVLKEGQPLFASGGSVSRNSDFHESKLNDIFEDMMDEHPDMVPPSGSFIPKEGLKPDSDAPAFSAISQSFKYTVPPGARQSKNIEYRDSDHPSMPTSSFGLYTGPMDLGQSNSPDTRPVPLSPTGCAGIRGMAGTPSGPVPTRATTSPWTVSTTPEPFRTEVVSAQARGGTVTMENSMTKGLEKSNQASPDNPEQHTLNPEHLPEHERAHIENPQAAHSKAAWMLPYLRAGAESVKRGGDFFGGDEQYERELAALQHFYHGPKQAPVAEEAPTAKEGGFKHGGSVNKKIVSIRDTFKRRLEGKERKLSSMEKAHARKSNPMLSKRISLEKKEVERMKQHIEKIKSHIS